MSRTQDASRDMLADPAIHEHWVSKYRTPETERFYGEAFDEIARRLAAPPGATILDAGCGSCAKSVLLAARGFRVVGADFSAEALGLAAEALRTRGFDDRVTLRRADLLDLPFRDGEFRYILCWGVLMHVPELRRALAELTRVLAPGGTLVVSEGNMHAVESVVLRTLKKILRRGRGRIVRTPAGLESHEHTDHGALVTRQTDMGWFTREGERLGLHLEARIAGQFTELYVLAPWAWLRRAIHAMNHVWFRYVGWAGPAFGNILIFRKGR
ncbi:MAG: class I SAM-dependent methyltransferase [Vicinamibacterales bacterium]